MAGDKPVTLLSAKAPGVYGPLGRYPPGRAGQELFLGLTQAAALDHRWGLHLCEPLGRKCCFLPWAAGMG